MPLGHATSVLGLLAVAAVWFVYYRRRDRLELAFAAAIAGLLAFAKVLSPQYLVWLIPFVPFGGVAAGALFARRARAGAELVLPLPASCGRSAGRSGRCSPGTSCWSGSTPFLLWKTSTPSREKTSRQSGLWRRRTSAAAAGSGADRSA